MPLGWDHHTSFNVAVYILIYILIFFMKILQKEYF